MAPTGIPPSKEIDYIKVCFVIMPFGKKPVGDKEIDFDFIYHTVFEPAIAAVVLPEGGQLVPKRTDQDYATGNIDVEMFRYLEYSRFALVDITGLNANVFYELGVRHRGNQSGTAIFRQEKTPLPFDIGHIKAFPYDYEPIEQVPASIEKITRVLSESLVYNRVDSPVQVALQDQQKSAQQARQKGEDDSEAFQIAATNAMRIEDWQTAIDRYKDAVQANEQNPLLHTELGLLLRDQGRWPEAVKNFERATQLSPDYRKPGANWGSPVINCSKTPPPVCLPVKRICKMPFASTPMTSTPMPLSAASTNGKRTTTGPSTCTTSPFRSPTVIHIRWSMPLFFRSGVKGWRLLVFSRRSFYKERRYPSASR